MRRGERLGLGVVVLLALAACGPSSKPGGDAAQPQSVTPPTIRVSPFTPKDAKALQPAEAAAIIELGRVASTAVPQHAHGHSEVTKEIELPLFTGDQLVLNQQWAAAVAAAPQYDTVAKAVALGYVRASAPGAGIGTHYVKWSLINQPFDPAHPSMLLFDERKLPAKLVGYSYLVRSATEPVGFAGPYDKWHQHTGLCVVNGYVDRERAAGPSDCAGTYLAGSDLWMVHAWVVPGMDNRDGRFANLNPKLCPSAQGTPDLLRCPDGT